MIKLLQCSLFACSIFHHLFKELPILKSVFLTRPWWTQKPLIRTEIFIANLIRNHCMVLCLFNIYLTMLSLSFCTQDFHCIMRDLLLLWTDSQVVALGLSCSATHGILVPRQVCEPASSALQGRFLTTGPPGKSPLHDFKPRIDGQICESKQ